MVKHPRTFHLPWSEGISSDDKIIETLISFIGREIVVTEKRDGECTSLYRDGLIHARSLSGTSHPWQDVIKRMWRERCHDLPEGWRVVGENLYAQHSVRYDNLIDWIEVFAIFDETNTALSWKDMLEWCDMLSLTPVPTLWKGKWDEDFIRRFHNSLNLNEQEGYVIRVNETVSFGDWKYKVAKWVREGHIQTDEHWTKVWVPNSKR